MWKPLRPKQGVAHEHPHPANYYKLCWNMLNLILQGHVWCSFCVCLALDVLPVSSCFCVFMFGLPPTNSHHRPASPTTLSASGKFCGNRGASRNPHMGVTWSYLNYFQNLPNMERLVLQYLWIASESFVGPWDLPGHHAIWLWHLPWLAPRAHQPPNVYNNGLLMIRCIENMCSMIFIPITRMQSASFNHRHS